MLIAHFGPAQADVYLPAMIALTVAALGIAVPLVLAPALRGGRGLAVRLVAGVLVVGGIGAAVVLAIPAQQALAAQVPTVQQQIADRYGLHVPAALVGRLLDGDTVGAKQAVAFTGGTEPVRLEEHQGRYELVRTESTADATTQFPVTGG